MLKNFPITLFGISPISSYYACFYAFQKCIMLLSEMHYALILCVISLCREVLHMIECE